MTMLRVTTILVRDDGQSIKTEILQFVKGRKATVFEKQRERIFILSLKHTNVYCLLHPLAIVGVLEMRKGHVEQARAFFQVITIALLSESINWFNSQH